MAEYWEDWSGYTIGDDPTVDGPAGWTRRWHADESQTIVDISSDSPPTGYTRAFRYNAAGTDRRFWSLDAVDSDGDRATVKVAVLVRAVGTPAVGLTSYGGGAARGSGTTTTETGLAGVLVTDGEGDETLNIIQYNNASGTVDLKSTAADEWSTSTWYWLVTEFNGTTVDVYLYPENDPGGTPITFHQRTGVAVTAAGWAGIFTFGETLDLDFAAVNIATGASTLSYADPSSGTTGSGTLTPGDSSVSATVLITRTASGSMVSQDSTVSGFNFVETIALTDDFDSAIGTVSVTNENTATPTFTITPADQGDVTGWLNVYVRGEGVNGKTPNVVIDCTNSRYGGIPNLASWGPMWRAKDDATVPADGRPLDWNEYDNISPSGDVLTVFNNSPFAFDELEIAFKPRWRYLDTQRAISYVDSTAYGFELPSSIAAGGLPKNVHAQVTHTGTPQNSAPATTLNLYCIGVDDTSVSPSSGGKLNFILLPGQHSSEDQGSRFIWEMVYFYTDGVGTVANWFRQHCRLHIYDVNPAGRYYGKERFTEETGGDEDPNRAWDDSGSEQVNAVKAAVAADLIRTDVLLDGHGHFGLNGNGISATYGFYEDPAKPLEDTWQGRINTLISPLVMTSIDSGNIAGSAQHWANYTLGVQLAITAEFGIASPGYPAMETEFGSIASAYIEAIQEMVVAEELTLAESGAGTLQAGSPTISATVVLARTASGTLTAQDSTISASVGITGQEALSLFPSLSSAGVSSEGVSQAGIS